MSDSIMSKANGSIDDILKYVKPQDEAGELDMAYSPTALVNKCNSTILWSQSWGGMVIRYGCMSSGATVYVSHDVRWYDYSFNIGDKETTRVMVSAGSTITLHNDDF